MKGWRVEPYAAWVFTLITIMSPLIVTPSKLVSQETSLISFELKDQFDQVHRETDFAERILIIIGSDRDGSEYSPAWGQALHDSLVADPGFERIAFVPVAKVTGVPFFLKGMVRGRFPKEPDQWALIDWGGVFDEAYGFVPESTNILLFAKDGSLALHSHGQEVNASVLEEILGEVRALLSQGD